jgi:hypothetical protein
LPPQNSLIPITNIDFIDFIETPSYIDAANGQPANSIPADLARSDSPGGNVL